MNFKNENRTLLILDLDETLIHASSAPLDRPADFRVFSYYVYKRPFLREFIDQVSRHFSLAVWSSASDDYVQEIAQTIFEDGPSLDFVWGRSRCTYRMNPYLDEYRYFNLRYREHVPYLKTLKKVKRQGYTLERVLIVDDTPGKLIRNYGNAVYVREYEGASNDDELPMLAKYLIKLKDEKNVRRIEKRSWRMKG